MTNVALENPTGKLLAHWASDVVAGLALGALTERLLRPLTGFGTTQKAPGLRGPRASLREKSPER